MKVGIAGAGVVGGALARVLEEIGTYEIGIYDPHILLRDLSALDGSDIAFVCVWTPIRNGTLDESAVLEAVDDLASRSPGIIAIKSTVLPGTMSRLVAAYPDQRLAFVPEFLVEADPVGSMKKSDRIVVGVDSYRSAEVLLVELLEAVTPGAPTLVTGLETAVMIKLGSNALLAAKVAIANELALIGERYGVRWDEVRAGIGLDRRIGPDHLRVTAELGYGGSCFPKDIRGLIRSARRAGASPYILEAIEAANGARFRG